MVSSSVVVRRARVLSAVGALVAALAVMVAPLSGARVLIGAADADTSPPAGQPATVSADALPTVQINGVVWSQVTVGSTVYATGKFTQARPAGVKAGGTGTVTRSNLLAYNITTGNLITSFAHSLNGEGRAVTASPDGSRVYVGGTFTTVDGVAHNRLVAFDTATGAVVSSFKPSLNSVVYALTATNSTVYAGGSFTSANGSARTRLAAYTSAGALTTWNPGANSTVKALVVAPGGSKVVVGGQFTTLANTATIGMGAVDAATGSSQPWAANSVIQDGGSNAAVGSLTTDGNRVYGSGWSYHSNGNFEGRFALDGSSGAVVWMNSCHGDSYNTVAIGPVLYSASHEHDCSDIGAFSQDAINVFDSTHHYTEAEATVPSGDVLRHPIYPCCPIYHDFAGQPRTQQLYWYPTYKQGTFTGQSQAAWSVSGNSQYLSVGGEFPTVNGTAQQGLVRFALSAIAPNKQGPRSSAGLTPVVRSQSSGTARVAWQSTWDPDNSDLRYRVYRDGGATAVYDQTVTTQFWRQPSLGFADTGLTPGSTHSYVVRVSDPSGNTVSGSSTSVTVGSATADAYTSTVVGDGASNFWPLDEPSGSNAFDRAGFADVTTSGAVTRGASGPIAGTSSTTFGGGETTVTPPGGFPTTTPNDSAGTTGTFSSAGPFSVEAWFTTTSTAGGAIAAQGLFASGSSQTIDKAVYLDNAGNLHFGVQNNTAVSTIASPASYNDGQWHHVVGTYDGTTGVMYVDGAQVASGAMTDDITFPAHWRIGGESLRGWAGPGTVTTNYLAGSIADVAVYPAALSGSQVASHYSVAGGGPAPDQQPTAAFTSSCTDHDCTFDGTTSSDDHGITAYHWDFGDSTTDDSGPTPPTHHYATDGPFTVTLTVTDTNSQTDPVDHVIDVPPPPAGPVVFADDAWNRTVAGGFGTAGPSGGPWSTSGSGFSVTPGTGLVALTANQRSSAWLGSVSQQDVDVTTSISLNKLPTGTSPAYNFFLIGRRISATEGYATRVTVNGSGAVTAALVKFDGAANATVLGSTTAAGTVTAGGVIHIRMQITGTGPTSLSFKTWNGAAGEPATWTGTTTDSSAAIQSPGSPGLQGFLSSGVTNGPVAASVGELVAEAP